MPLLLRTAGMDVETGRPGRTTNADAAINGLRMDQHRLSIIPPYVSVDIVLGQGAYPLTMLVPVDRYENYSLAIGSEFAPANTKIVAIDVCREGLEPLVYFLMFGLGLFALFELVASDDAAYDSKVINIDKA